MISGFHITNENEIIAPVSFQNEGGMMAASVVGDNKIEKHEKREKEVKSNSKMNTKVFVKCDKNAIITDDVSEKREKVKKEKVKKIVNKREDLSMNNYSTLLVVNYKMDELKKLCTKYKIQKGGNKDELTKRLYEYCKNSVAPLKIQKVFRG